MAEQLTDHSEHAEHESARSDDRIIGQALRWSLAVIVVIAGIVVSAILWSHRSIAKPAVKLTTVSAPQQVVRPESKVPTVTFTDITTAAGINFTHASGAYGAKLLPETMGGGVAFFDANGDGFPDLLFVNSGPWPDHPSSAPQSPKLALYLNDGHGHFTDATAGSGLDTALYGMGIAIGDYDNDGREDVFITGVGGYDLFHNLGNGKFERVTDRAGVGGDKNDWGTGAAFIDYDNDGKLDLFVCNYVRWSPEIDKGVGYSLVGVGRAYGPPTNFQGAFCHLYHNRGDGTFEDVSQKAGIQVANPATKVPAGKSLSVAPIDIDGDGWMDLIVANDTVQNFVFRNQHDGTFEEMGAMCGIAFDSYGNTRGAMGIDTARFRNDPTLAIGVGNFANEMTALYVSSPGDQMLFTDEAIPQGIGPASRLLLKFGLFFFDYDLDGWPDLLTADGHLEQEISKVQQSQTYRQPAQLFWNAGSAGGGFVVVPPQKTGNDLRKPIVGRGSAFADIDGDGDLDVILTQVDGPPLLLRNDQSLGHHWLRLKLIGTRCNRDAIGAQVRVKLAEQTLWQQVMPTRSYLSQSELPVTFGLGDQAGPVDVAIQWPDGSKQTLSLPPDKLRVITEP